jgi:hypothetical protein
MNQRKNLNASPGRADEEYVFERNAARWKYVRLGLLGVVTALVGLTGLVIALCLQTPSLPDLALDPTNSRVYALHHPPVLKTARLARRSGDALTRSLLLRSHRFRHPSGRKLVLTSSTRRHL